MIQIDSIHMDEDLILVAEIGVDAKGDKHPLRPHRGERRRTPRPSRRSSIISSSVGSIWAVLRLFIVDGAKALSKAIRRTFGAAPAIQRCQVHKARNIMERLPKSGYASVRRMLRQAWGLDMPTRPKSCFTTSPNVSNETGPGSPARSLEGIDEILTVTRLGLPKELRRSLACTNIIENVMGTVRRLPQRRGLGLDGDALGPPAAMREAAKGFRRLKAHKHAALETPGQETQPAACLLAKPTQLNINLSSGRFAMFYKQRDITRLHRLRTKRALLRSPITFV